MSEPTERVPDQVADDLARYTVVDVRTPGEYASGHLPGAHNVPLDHLPVALPSLRAAGSDGELLLVCASGARSSTAVRRLAVEGVPALSLAGGTDGWVREGRPVRSLTGSAGWSMERQVRFTAGSLVLVGLALGARRPRARLLSAAIGGGLVFSALTDTCGLAHLLGRLPHNQPEADDLERTLAALRKG
ncbi:rhodanese-like domain-containing protein [Streptomyces sp. NPDC005438]|uniref:rhodanese-like domain-containing protein n=1 Tax=Streptomyces sp. NPDC005438 TaxID=3156880 RepID=UPI0033AE1406